MPNVKYIFLQDFIDEGFGTIYVLSDSDLNVRDSLALDMLKIFFKGLNIKIEDRKVLAEHRSYFSRFDIERLLANDPKHKEKISNYLKNLSYDNPDDIDNVVEFLLDEVEQARIDEAKKKKKLVTLEPTGPIIFLGRPAFHPMEFEEQVNDELDFCANSISKRHRFGFVSNMPDTPGYRTIIDNYTNQRVESRFKIRSEIQEDKTYNDYAIIRKVKGAYKGRSFIYAYGNSSLGTRAAAQVLIDPAFQKILSNWDVDSFVQNYGNTEILMWINIKGLDISMPWTRSFSPTEIEFVTKPCAPIPESITYMINKLADESINNGGKHNGNKSIDTKLRCLYDPIPKDKRGNVYDFKVIGIHPKVKTQDKYGPHAYFMVGGKKIENLVNGLEKKGSDKDRTPVYLYGETGVGKELATKIIYQARTLNLIKEISQEKNLPTPVMVGSRFTPINGATISGELAESKVFGIKKMSATNVNANRGFVINSGEGIFFIDECNSIKFEDQGILLRLLDPPYNVTPIPTSLLIPSSALIVVATNQDLNTLVLEGKIRLDLQGRLEKRKIAIPPLSERWEEIPAILTFIAKEPICISESVFRCLLVAKYTHNVRDLYKIVGKAKERKEQCKIDEYSSLEITLADLDEEIIESFSDIPIEHRAKDHTIKERIFRFEIPDYFDIDDTAFEKAALILTSVRLKKTSDGKYAIEKRTASREYEDIWPTDTKGGAPKTEILPKGEFKDTDDILNQWFDLVSYISSSLKDNKLVKEHTLQMMGSMFSIVVKGGVREQFMSHYFAEGYYRDVSQADCSMSLGIGESYVSNFRNEGLTKAMAKELSKLKKAKKNEKVKKEEVESIIRDMGFGDVLEKMPKMKDDRKKILQSCFKPIKEDISLDDMRLILKQFRITSEEDINLLLGLTSIKDKYDVYKLGKDDKEEYVGSIEVGVENPEEIQRKIIMELEKSKLVGIFTEIKINKYKNEENVYLFQNGDSKYRIEKKPATSP